MDKKKRIVVTGMGVVSCFGTDVKKFYQSLLEGKSGIRPIESFDVEEYPTRFAGEVTDFEVGDYMEKKQARRVDPCIRYAIVAGKKALESAGLDKEALDKLDKSKCGVLIGSGMGGLSVLYDGTKTILEKGHKRLTPFFIPYIITNMGELFSLSTLDSWDLTIPFPQRVPRGTMLFIPLPSISVEERQILWFVEERKRRSTLLDSPGLWRSKLFQLETKILPKLRALGTPIEMDL